VTRQGFETLMASEAEVVAGTTRSTTVPPRAGVTGLSAVRRRTADTRDQLTPQEAQIARLGTGRAAG